MSEDAELLCEAIGQAGVITLNRPKALNALTLGMIRTFHKQLRAWESDPHISRVIVKGAGGRAFCAGGDIRQLRDWLTADDPLWHEFYAEEYRLNAYIKHYPKPYVALIDGIVMGGGVGVSVHGSHRIATENIRFAMPEVGIGLFPDVGGSYFLPRIRNHAGVYLAMTGASIRLADATWAGIATHAVRAEDLTELEAALAETDSLDETLTSLAVDPGDAALASLADTIDALFSRDTVAEILDGLDDMSRLPDDWGAKTAATIRAKSPTSLCVTRRQLKEGAALDFNGCMKMEYRMVCRMLQDSDFIEGVRAVIIDKDNKPSWRPARIADVPDALIDAHFKAPPWGDLEMIP